MHGNGVIIGVGSILIRVPTQLVVFFHCLLLTDFEAGSLFSLKVIVVSHRGSRYDSIRKLQFEFSAMKFLNVEFRVLTSAFERPEMDLLQSKRA